MSTEVKITSFSLFFRAFMQFNSPIKYFEKPYVFNPLKKAESLKINFAFYL